MEQEKRFDKIDNKLEEFVFKFDNIDKKFDKIDDKLEDHDQKLDFLARTVAEHSEKLDYVLDNMATKEDMSKIMNTLDKIVGLYTKKDEEQTLLAHDQKNLTDRVEVLEKDMRHVKPALGLA